jgi:ribosomal protein S18 acetylase RimI-like enzyme
MPRVVIRAAREDELPAVGRLTVDVYVGGGFVNPDEEYVETLRDAQARAADGEVLVAVSVEGELLGATAVFTAAGGPRWFENARPDDAVLRMLAVAPGARGQGVGELLTLACVERARALGCARLRLSTMPQMQTAHRLYERLGFERLPGEDWEPVPGALLWAYALPLARYCGRCGQHGQHVCRGGGADLEPPRFCAVCGRRMEVQVLPTGWSARCSRHGTLTS